MEKIFVPSYAGFVFWVVMYNKTLNLVLTKTKKTNIRPWGVTGGKEEKQDNRNAIMTALRESSEETGVPAKQQVQDVKKICEIIRKNDNKNLPDFTNYFYYSLLKEKELPIILNKKDSIVEVGLFSFQEVEKMEIKNNHMVAFVELCFVLEELAESNKDVAMTLMNLNYVSYKRPSENGWKLIRA